MTLRIALLVIVGLFNIVLALMVLARDHRKLVNAAFFVLALSCAAWVFGIVGFLTVNTTQSALDWAKFYYAAPVLLVASSIVVADLFPIGNVIHKKKMAFLIMALISVTVPLLFVPDFVTAGIAYRSWGKEILLNKPDYLLYSAYIVFGFCWMLTILAGKMKKERGISRVQAQIFFYGTMGSALFGTLFNLFLPWFGNYRLIWVGPLATSIYLSTTLYSIVKHKLFDIRLIIARSIGYILSIVALGTLFGASAFVIVTLVLNGQVASVSERVVSASLAVALAIIFRPVKRFFDRITNKLFYRDAYDTQVLIDSLNHILVATIELDTLLYDTSKLLQDTLKAQYCIFALFPLTKQRKQVIGTSKQFEDSELLRIARLVPRVAQTKVILTDSLDTIQDKRLYMLLQSNDIAMLGSIGTNIKQAHEILGYVFLGPKKSGNPYSSQDQKVLDVVVNELVIAIQNALRFQEIERFNLTLQQKIDDATRKLRHTNDRLRVLDQTKDDFISMASHQLRTPLTSVKGYVSMVLDGDAGKITSLQRKLLNQSFISSQRMVYLISDLLNVSRLRTGKFIIEAVPTNLARVVQEEIEQLVEAAKSRDLELTYHKPEHFPTYMLDETKLRQVIMNFIDNAMYYTPSGGHISITIADKPKTIEFTVTDDGIGVPTHEQHHLFTKFYRAPNAKRARPDGTGLGLFMAKKVIIAQGGAIIFKSREDHGSTFGFTFAKDKLQLIETK